MIPKSKMLKLTVSAIALSSMLSAAQAQTTLTVQVDKPGAHISPDLYGIFFEEINRAGDGGLYAEMLQNRSFEDSDLPLGWSLVTSPGVQATMTLDHSHPLNAENPTSLRLDITTTNGRGGRAGIANQGFKGIPAPRKTYAEFLQDQSGPWLSKFEAAQSAPDNGLAVQRGKKYDLSLSVRASAHFTGPLRVSLERQDGTMLAGQQFTVLGPNWKPFRAILIPTATDPDARLVVSATHPGTVWLDMVSLFPVDTFKGRPNGLRPDLARMLTALHPAFIRFPGGSYAEGHILTDSFRWKQTVGDLAQRPGHWNIWGYRSSDGLGYHEYLQMCEDLGAKPLFVVNCGMAEQGFVPVSQLGPWIQDALDAVEYANGPVTSHWGALRAKNGHPASFHLKYVEIGNENGMSYPWGGGTPEEYLARYRPFYNALHARYPHLTLICNTKIPAPADIVDEHYYDTEDWFAGHATLYDDHARTGPKVYVGEYAVNRGAGGGNLGAALGEAAFLTGVERNGDIVAMASYAPLFVNPSWSRWSPDAIVFDSTRVYGTPSYYVQKLFANNRADLVLPVTLDTPADTAQTPTLFAMAGRRTATGEVILKVVNISGKPCAVDINLAGTIRDSVGTATILSGTDPQDENSFDTPRKISPRTEPIPLSAPRFHRTFPAYSITILRLRTKNAQ